MHLKVEAQTKGYHHLAEIDQKKFAGRVAHHIHKSQQINGLLSWVTLSTGILLGIF